MSNYGFKKETSGSSKLSAVLMTLASATIGGGLLWFVWFRYTSSLYGVEISWYNWIQLTALALMGVLCLAAGILFLTGKPSGWTLFKTSLLILPLLLFSNLIVFLFRVIQSTVQGNGISLLSRLYASPLNKAILGVILIIIVLSALKEIKRA